MAKKISNDQNIKNLQKRKILRYFIIVFSLLTIILSLLSLFYNVNILLALLAFIITTVLQKIRNNTVINKTDDLKSIREEIKKVKK